MNIISLKDFGQVYKSSFNYRQLFLERFYDKQYKYKFCVGDIEAHLDENNNFIFSLGVVYDGKNFHYSYTIEDYFSILQSLKVKQIYFHNLNFDFIFFLRECFLGENVTMVQSGNMILRVKTQGVTFLNSLSILPMSLKKVVKSFLKIDWSEWNNQKDDIFGLNEDELLEYCMRDCFLTFLAVDKFKTKISNDYNVNKYLTIPSLALKIFNKRYISKDNLDNIFNISNRSHFFDKDYYFGGHTEKFVNNVYAFKDLNYYDVNSLYPYIMTITRVNVGGFKMVRPSIAKLKELIALKGVFYADVDLFIDSEDIRVFPTFINDSNFYRFGLIRVKISDISFQFLKDMGRLDCIKKVHGILIPKSNDTVNIFKDFVQDLYSLRKSDKENEIIFKLLLNSLYGKYGQKVTIETHKINNTERDDFKRIVNHNDLNFLSVHDDDVKGNTLKFSRFDIAGRITEGARILMSRYRNLINSKGGKVLYQDTDSFIGSFDLVDLGLDNIFSNTELGKMKKENDGLVDGILIGQKLYYLSNGSKASKGVKLMFKHDYERLMMDIIIKKIINHQIKIVKWTPIDFTLDLFLFPKSSFYNLRFTQYKSFMKSGFFGIQHVPHYISNIRERIDGRSGALLINKD